MDSRFRDLFIRDAILYSYSRSLRFMKYGLQVEKAPNYGNMKLKKNHLAISKYVGLEM